MRWWWSAQNIGPEIDAIQLALSELMRGVIALEGKVSEIATRAELDAAKQALSAEIAQVKTHIDQLDAQIAAGQPITQADIDDLKNDLAQLQGTDQPPTPAPQP